MTKETITCPQCGTAEDQHYGLARFDHIVPGRIHNCDWQCMKCGYQRTDEGPCPPVLQPITLHPDKLLAFLRDEEPLLVKMYLTMIALAGVNPGEPFSVRIEDIAEVAGVAHSSLYRHFPRMVEKGYLQIEPGQGRSPNTYRFANIL